MISKSLAYLSTAASGDPVITTIVIMLFFVMVNLMIAQIEILIWGERFEHWGDIILALLFIGYAGAAVRACAHYKLLTGGGA